MNGKSVRIDFSLCDASTCDPEKGECTAVIVCKKKLLEQEEPYDSPWLLSASLCVGCGDCVRACSLGAIIVDRSG